MDERQWAKIKVLTLDIRAAAPLIVLPATAKAAAGDRCDALAATLRELSLSSEFEVATTVAESRRRAREQRAALRRLNEREDRLDRMGYGEHCSGSDGGDRSEISDDWRRPGVTRAESDAGRIDWALPRERMRVVASEVALLSVQRYRFPSGNESRHSNERDHGGNVQRVDSDGVCHRLVRGVVSSLRERYGVDASLSPCLAHSGDIVEREREEGGVKVSYLLSLSSHSALLGANSPHLF